MYVRGKSRAEVTSALRDVEQAMEKLESLGSLLRRWLTPAAGEPVRRPTPVSRGHGPRNWTREVCERATGLITPQIVIARHPTMTVQDACSHLAVLCKLGEIKRIRRGQYERVV